MPRVKKNGNGSNGNGQGHRMGFTAQSVKTDDEGHLIIDDLVPASVLLMFFCQKLGKASTQQIAEKVASAGVVMNLHLLEQAIEALQARQFVSYGKGKDPSGEVVDQWKPRKANFSGIPDVAQVSQSFLSDLVATDDASELISALNESEEKGDGEAKATEKLKYADYYVATVTFQTCSTRDGGNGMLLGGHPSSDFYDAVVRKGPKCPTKADLRFPRDNEGHPVIPVSNIRGWLGGLRCFNRTPAAVGYIGITGGQIQFDGEIKQYAHQIVDLSGGTRGGGGRGITTYECIAPGARFTFQFVIPRRGGWTFKQFVAMLTIYAPQSPRGLSNARSNENGFCEVVDAKLLGDLRYAQNGLRAVSGILSTAGKEFAEAFLKDLGEKSLDLFVGGSKDGEPDDYKS